MADIRTIERARAALVISIEQELVDWGNKLKKLGAELLDENRDAENRLDHMFGVQGVQLLAGIHGSKLQDLKTALRDFDRLGTETENGVAKHEIALSNDNFEGERGIDKLHNLKGTAAVLKRALDKAGYRITVESRGMYAVLVITR